MPEPINLTRLSEVLEDAANYVAAHVATGGRVEADAIPFSLDAPVMQNLLREIESLGLAVPA